MMTINTAMLISGVLLFLGIASSKFSTRLGMPVLVFFLGIGMLAGSEGVGGIAFENYELANNIGSVALAMILFDGGLRTSFSSVRMAWRPALSLSTVGVLLTSLLTGVATAWILDLPLLHGILLGAIVGSTDAAAVFSVLRTSGLKLPERLTATLEVESGSNDPMALFLTLGLVDIITSNNASLQGLLIFFLLQFGIGTLVGFGVGAIAVWIVNRINLNHAGLYPILVMSFGLLAFSLAAVTNGSGFLAVYVAGIVIGNQLAVFKRGTFLFHDAVAWLNQILLFVMLGLLSFPSRLWEIASSGFAIALVLIIIARPLAVIVSLYWFRFSAKELTFLSWAGLKGAVPITLATFPLMAGIPGSERLFNIVFFAVLVSAIAQGWTLSTVARWLGLGVPTNPPPLTIEIDSLRKVDGQIVDYTVAPSARVAGQMLRTLALPNGVMITVIVRDGHIIIPRGTTNLHPGDHVYVAMHSQLKPFIDNLFEPGTERSPLSPGLEFSFRAESTAEQIRWFFNLPVPTWSAASLATLIEAAEPRKVIELGPFEIGKEETEAVTLKLSQSWQPYGEFNNENSIFHSDNT